MARKPIDIGAIGNDGTGDSIRDAFRKVNDNFRELYSSLGLGEKLRFTGLDDTPSNYFDQENAILSVGLDPTYTETDGTGIVFKKLVPGVGVVIDFDTPNEIKFSTEFSEIRNDRSPKLGGDLLARSGGEQFRIFELTPYDFNTQAGGPIFPTEAVSKDYADSKISRHGVNAINPATGLVTQSFGTMTGPLILSRDPVPEDDLLFDGKIAVTKSYVDTAGFASTVNLYVATSGDDARVTLNKDIQGKSLASAFRSIEAALKRAEELVLEAPVDLGPYQKTLTFDNGQSNCELAAIITSPDSGTGFSGRVFMSVDSAEFYIDPIEDRPTVGVNYEPGDILTIFGGFGVSARIEVLTTVTTPGPISTFRILSQGLYEQLPGSTNISTTSNSNFGAGAKFNLKYKVNSIVIDNPGGSLSNPSFTDYSLVSVRISGGGGRGAFGTANVVNGQIDSITITDTGSGFTSLPNLVVDLPRFLISTNFLRTDFTGDVLTSTPEAFRSRDIREGLLIKGEISGALAIILAHDGVELDTDGNEIFDMDIISGNFQIGETLRYGDASKNIQISVLVETGIYEENYPLKIPQNVAVIGDEFRRVIVKPKAGTSSSPWAFGKFRRDEIIDGLTVTDRLYGYHYLLNSSLPIHPKINNPGNFDSAAAILEINKTFIQEEVISWISNQIVIGIPPFTQEFQYNEQLLKRDVGLIIDALVFDLKFGSYNRTISAALKYKSDGGGLSIITQLSEIEAAIEKINELSQEIIRNQEVFPVFSETIFQIIDESFSSERGAGALENTIINASNSNPVRITTAKQHFYRNKEKITISDISSGMTQLNGGNFYVKNLNGVTFDLYQDFDLSIPVNGTNFGIYVEGSGGVITPEGGVLGELINSFIDVITSSTLVNEPLENQLMDVFLCNDANIIRAVTAQGHGGFMMVLDPEGQILAKSPYCQEAASFSRSINTQTFSGGMFVDGFTGNLQFTHESSLDIFNISVSGLDRTPLTPFSFIVNDVVHRVNYFRNFSYDPRGSSADFALDETTPFRNTPGKINVAVIPGPSGVFNKTDHGLQVGATLKFYSTGVLPAPLENNVEYYVVTENLSNNNFSIGLNPSDTLGIEITSTGSGTISYQRVYEILMPGNRSMLSNDYTQVNDLGYGLIATNGGLTEAVSMFTYYCHISYYSLNGGQIRSIAGSSAHGNYALVAEGADPLEIPTPVTIFDDFSQRVICYAPTQGFTQGPGDLFVFVTGYRSVPILSAELEVDHGNQIFRYPVTSVSTAGLPEGVARLNLASDDSGNISGLFAGIPDGTRLTYRNSGAVILTGDVVDVATRPSTGLVLKETPDVYRILQFNIYQDENAPYEVQFTPASSDIEVLTTIVSISSNICTTFGNHLLDPGDKFIPKISSNGLTSGSTYYVIDVPEYNQFILSTSINGSAETLTDGTTLGIKGAKSHKLIEDYVINFTSFVALFDGNITGTTLSVDILEIGKIRIGQVITGNGVASGTTIVSFDTGSGGVGTYTVSISQTVSSTGMSAIATPPQEIAFDEEYYVIENGLTDTSFRVSLIKNGDAITVTDVGSGLYGYSDKGLALTTTRENYNYIDLTLFQPGELVAEPFTCVISVGSPGTITHVSHGLVQGDVIRFLTTGTLPTGLTVNRNYFVFSIISPDEFTVSESPLSLFAIDISGVQSGIQRYGKIKGEAGTQVLPVVAVAPQERPRIPGSIFYFKGERYVITDYEDEGSTQQPFARITLSRPLLDDIIKFSSPYTIKSAVSKRTIGSTGTLTIRISLTRVTGHDLLEIGTGSYADTNYPNEIYGPPVNSFDASKETEERDVGRVFYVTTDQFGNFRVGPFFEVDQGTGRVTFSAAIALSNLDGIGFKRGVPIAEFSVDATMSDNAIDTVPTENAVRGYIEKRLGITHTGSPVPSAQLIPPINGGFLPLNGQLPMKNQLSMNNFRIVSVGNPVGPQDAVNLRSLTFGNFQNIEFNNLSAADIMVFTGAGDSAINASVVGDVKFDLRPGIDSTLNLVDVQITPGAIINQDINANAGVQQSKLAMNIAGTRLDAVGITQANRGLATFDYRKFNSTNGWIEIRDTTIVRFTGFISGTTLTVSTLTTGTMRVENTVFGIAGIIVSPGTVIVEQLSGTPGGVGTYQINISQNVGTSIVLAGFRSFNTQAPGITLDNLQTIPPTSVIGNNSNEENNTAAIQFSTVVNVGGAIKKSQYGNSGFLRRRTTGVGTADADYEVIEMSSTQSLLTLVQRDSAGDFAARIVDVEQLKIDGKVTLDSFVSGSGGYIQLYGYLNAGGILIQDGTAPGDRKTGYWNNQHNFKTLDGQLDAPITCSQVQTLSLSTGGNTTAGTITGRWTLTGTSPNESRLQATYSADLAEYYEGDEDYEVGTVLVFGGDKEVTISTFESDTRIAGVVSNTAAFVMYDACPGKKNLIALQGRVPCRVIGKIQKGDLLITSSIPGVAISSKNVLAGTIVGKAIENYDSEEIGTIEIAVGRT
jgi:hypothetical protein